MMASELAPCKKCGIPFIGKYCKPCDNARSTARRRADPKKASAAVTEWKKSNPERTKELNRLSYQRNRESKAAKARVFRRKNRTRLDAYNKAYDLAHPEQKRERRLRRARKDVDEISDKYVKSVLGIWKLDAPPALIAAARAIIQIRRFIKENK